MRRRDGASLALTWARVATGMKNTILHVPHDLKDAWTRSRPDVEKWPASTSNAAQTRLLDSLVCASWRALDRGRLFEGGWSTTAACWMVQDVAQAFSTTRWVEGGVGCPRKEPCPKLGHVPLAVCRVADDGFMCVFEIEVARYPGVTLDLGDQLSLRATLVLLTGDQWMDSHYRDDAHAERRWSGMQSPGTAS